MIVFSGIILSIAAKAQYTFNYKVTIEPFSFPELPALYSFAFGSYMDKWVIIGGRTDGLHARQPFNAFPGKMQNTFIYVIDPNKKLLWKKSVNSFPVALREQLQSSNMNFFQDGDTLYLAGGYAYAESKDDHITFPNLTTVQVSKLIEAIIKNKNVANCFKQIAKDYFAVTGGNMGKINDELMLAGGHRFDGRYNPMNNPTFVQEYTNEIRFFRILNTGKLPAVTGFRKFRHEVHLHRRDYNLIPQIEADGSESYTMASGVFQISTDLPFQYPVVITDSTFIPDTKFNQYLSHYHTPTVSLHSRQSNSMYHLFFGGISRYYYENNSLKNDDEVPFVNTISLLSRSSGGIWNEYKLDAVMPFTGHASGAFFLNPEIKHDHRGIIEMDAVVDDTLFAGFIYGGLISDVNNPFSNNETELTAASTGLWRVLLIKEDVLSAIPVNGTNPCSMEISLDEPADQIRVSFKREGSMRVRYLLTDNSGNLIDKGELKTAAPGEGFVRFPRMLKMKNVAEVTLIFGDTYYVAQKTPER